MRVLVTGAAGFIGSHLTEQLLRDGHEVVGFDDLSTGSAHNLVELLERDGFEFVRGSILDRERVEDLVADTSHIVHLAAAVGVHTILDDPLASLRTNLAGAEAVLDAALRHDRRILITSTSEVYGKNQSGPLDEDADRIMGSALVSRWSYAAAKALDEMIAHTYWRDHGLRVVMVRPFNTVGPRQTGRYGMVVPRFVEQALADEPITVCGDGGQRRCFLHVADLVPALAELLEHPRAYGEVFNLGGEEEITIRELAERIVALTGSSSPIVSVTAEELYGPGFEDMRRRVPNTEKAQRLIGFAPTHSIADIIRSVIDERRRHAIALATREPDPVHVATSNGGDRGPVIQLAPLRTAAVVDGNGSQPHASRVEEGR
jgi:UDP-glucose 4-epimerase